MSRTVQVSIDGEGNLLLPAEMRGQVHLSPGMTLVVESDAKGDLRLRVQRERSVLVEKEGLTVARVKAWEDLSDVVRHERERRVLDLLQRVGL